MGSRYARGPAGTSAARHVGALAGAYPREYPGRMMMPAARTPREHATEADLLALPEQGRGYELLDGELVEKQSGFRHGRAQVAQRGERVRPEPFTAVELAVGVLFGDDDDTPPEG